MSKTCQSCGHPLFDSNDPEDIKRALDRSIDGSNVDEWDSYADTYWDNLRTGKFVSIPGIGDVKLIDENIPKPYDSYYGEFHQGYEGEATRIIQIGEKFYKNTAPQNSYGRVRWHAGDLAEVQAKTKTIQVWE